MGLNIRILNYIVFFLIFTQISFAADSLEIISPSYFGEQKNVFDEIHYLENELLSFKFCTEAEAEEITAKIVCSGQEEKLKLFVDKNKDGCYFNNYNLQLAPCDEFSLEFDFSVDSKERKLSRDFKKEKQSTLINHVLGLNYQTVDPDEMTYYLVVQNEVESKDSDISEDIYDRLKESRDNDDKCWPKNSCDPITTSLILNNLKTAGYDLSTRLLEDGQQYLEKSTINNENNPLKFTINLDHNFGSSEEISCDIEIDGEDNESYIFDEDDNDIIEEFASETILFSCNATVDQIEFDLYNINDKVQLSEDYDDETSFNYDLSSFACAGDDDDCDYDSSLRNLDTYGSGFEDYNLIQTYLDSLILVDEDDEETKIDSNDVYEDTGKYLYSNSNGDLVDYLKFKQNNDGSWGSGSKDDKIIETAWGVLGLENADGTSEHLTDGKNWIYFNEPTSGWGSIKKNTLAYLAIKEQIKPYLKISAINELDETTYILINNPTIHNIKNLEISVSDKIKDYLSYTEDLGDLDGEDSLPFNISYKAPFFGTLTGDITITGLDGKNKELTLITFPINLKGPSPFSIEAEGIPISEETPFVEIIVTKNIDTFSAACTYKNPFTDTTVTQTINQNNLSLKISNPNLTPGEYDVDIECNSDGNTFLLSTPINVSIAKKTFEILETQINITSIFDFSISIHSLDTDKQILTFEIIGDYEGVINATEKDKIIAANDTREVFFSITNPFFLEALGSSSSGYILVTAESGYTQKIPIKVGTDTLDTQGESSLLSWILIIFAILLIGFIVLVIIRYFQLKKIHEEEGYEDDDEQYFDDGPNFK